MSRSEHLAAMGFHDVAAVAAGLCRIECLRAVAFVLCGVAKQGNRLTVTESPGRQTESPGRRTESPGRQTESPGRQSALRVRINQSPRRRTHSPGRPSNNAVRNIVVPAGTRQKASGDRSDE